MTAASNTWRAYFENLPNDDDGNRNVSAFSNLVHSDTDLEDKIAALSEERESISLVADGEIKIKFIHSPHNFGGTRSKPIDKIICLWGLGTSAYAVQIDEKLAIARMNKHTPSVDDIWNCTTNDS